MLKRVRMFYDLTVINSVSGFIFDCLKEEADKAKHTRIDVFYLAEDKKGLKDICIRIEGENVSKVKKCFDKFVDIASSLLKEVNNEFRE